MGACRALQQAFFLRDIIEIRSKISASRRKNRASSEIHSKMVRLTDVLRFIHSEESLRGFLALKGGTAINLTLFDLPRLSVDIDLDMTRNLPSGR